MEDLLQLQLLARQQRTPYAVATIVEATGSTPRTEGKMLVYADGRSAGTIGGGLAELRAKKDAADAIRCGKNRLVRYEVVPQAAASGMACGGALQVFIEVYGTRPLLVELQALVAPTPYVPPRRTSDAVDIKRIQLLLAVLEKRVHLQIGACDVYVKVAGGIRIDEPAADLGICVAMASSFAGRLLRPKTIVFGEVGLSGEVRAVSQAELRVHEAKRLGFRHVVLPRKNYEQIADGVSGIMLYGAATIGEALKLAMPREERG